MTELKPLDPELLYQACDESRLSFKTTDELEDLSELIGQARVLEALEFGVGIRRDGYNVYALGPAGVGRHTTAREYLERQAAAGAVPPDWIYINNFDQPHKPRVLQLPAGRGAQLRADMDQLLEELGGAIPEAFETEQYHARVREIEETFKSRREDAFGALAKEAEAQGITLVRTPAGFAFAPVRDGEVLGPDDFGKLPEEERERIEKTVAQLQEKLATIFHQMPQWQREARQRIKALNREIAMFAVGHLIEDLKKRHADLEQVRDYLDRVQADIIDHAEEFLAQEEASPFRIEHRATETPSLRRYQVNLLVDHSESSGAPVVYEDSPMYNNLVGDIEHRAQMGALTTDFTLIKPGALHRANGGYLLLDAHKVLLQPYAWEGLKRALFSGEIRIRSLGQIFSIVSTVSLEPEPIPLDVKVVLIGDRMLYYLLQAYDPDFGKLFKVAADFADRVDRSPENDMLYAQMIGTLVRKSKLLPVQRDGVARIIEQSARLVQDSEKLSTHIMNVSDLLTEADYWARKADRQAISRDDVQHAIDMQVRRADRLRERVYEEIQRETILIDTDGEEVGQVNGLSVLDLGNFMFGQPSRITATVRVGEGEVVDIEREVELGGAIHSKGVYILSAFLGARYASNRPLSLSASLVFEQSYGGVEGDSASMAELCALLSALSAVPIRQSVAITGSVNQHGKAQAIGGVNEKIEGFYDVCSARGLTGKQCVLVPASNVKHMMLRDDVQEAARDGRFRVFAYENVDQAVELLTGVPAGEADAEGNYPENSINQRVQARLEELAEQRKEFIKSAHEGGEHHE